MHLRTCLRNILNNNAVDRFSLVLLSSGGNCNLWNNFSVSNLVWPCKCDQYFWNLKIRKYLTFKLLSFSFPCSLHETEIHKEDHQLEPIYRAETFLDRDYCMSQGTSYNYLDPNYFPANRWHGKQIYDLGLTILFEK